MNASGIVRRIDDLGRVVIPKETRRMMKMHDNAPLEFYLDRDSIILKKYSTASNSSNIEQYAVSIVDSLNETLKLPVIICDDYDFSYGKGIPTKKVKELVSSIKEGQLDDEEKEYKDIFIMEFDTTDKVRIGVFSKTPIPDSQKEYINSTKSMFDFVLKQG